MRSFILLLAALLLHIGILPACADVDVTAVREAIDQGVKYLKRTQRPDGSWAPISGGRYKGGLSALCTLALLESGVPADDANVARGLENLRSLQPVSTYVVSLQTMALCRAGDPADLGIIRQNVRWLAKNQVTHGAMHGAWAYPEGRGDGSNTQFAILALHEAALIGVDVGVATWRSALGYWKRAQNVNGSWGYAIGGGAGRGSMTCAGIASVVIAQFHLDRADATIEDGDCFCERQADDKVVRNGLRWLGNHFSVTIHPSEDMPPQYYHYYYLYGVERVGRMTAQRFFHRDAARGIAAGRHDWYREGADYLVGVRRADGSWKGDVASVPHLGTSLALLFLSKGRRPVLISKLQRDSDDWQRLRHDVANLTQYTEKKWKIPLTWQVVDARTATVDDYAQTPVLFLSGEDKLDFNPQQVKALRDYVEQGGFIFADACCDQGDFDISFRKLMRDMFPEPQLRLQPLDPEHPIWDIEETPDPRFIRPDGRWLEGINVGCRTSVIYSPGNLSCYWELMRAGEKKRFKQTVQDEIAACRAVGINVLAYATNRELREKDRVPRHVNSADDKSPTARGHFAIAKLRHAGGCDAAPRALSNLMRSLEGELQIRTVQQPELLAITDDQIFDYHFLFLHGRYDFKLSAREVKQLRLFVERGGMIFADSICGSEQFVTAIRRELGRIFPKKQLERIPATDPILTPAYAGFDLKSVRRRETFRAGEGERLEVRTRQAPPVLEAIEVDDRYAVIFSPLDLSCALENHAAPQCRGYLPDDAKRIAINVILYSLHE